MTRLICCIAIGLYSVSTWSQCVITGTINDQQENPLLGVNVVYKSIEDSTIIAFAISDKNGLFELKVEESSLLQSFIEVSMLGKKLKRINNLSCKNFKVFLEDSDLHIDEIIVKAYPVEKYGDTLDYNLESFKKEGDVYLSDVLKHLPGIEVLGNGQIVFQGESINKFYIEGSDLLGGRYNIASENLRADNISSVQVIKNHQPKKVLKDVEFTDKAALNIKLKNNFSGAAPFQIGLGAPRWMREVSVSPMVFNSKIQSINLLETNSAGKSLKNISQNLYEFEIDLNNSVVENIEDHLSLRKLGNPPIKKRYWYDNNSFALGSNVLYKIKSKEELRVSAHFSDDVNSLDGNRLVELQQQGNVLTLSETFRTTEDEKEVKSDIAYENNSDHLYVKNNLSFGKENMNGNGTIVGDVGLENSLLDKNKFVKNEFSSHFKINSQIVNFDLDFENNNRNELLEYEDFEGVVEQKFDLNNSIFASKISVSHLWKGFLFEPSFGMSLASEELESETFFLINNEAKYSNQISSSYLHINPSVSITKSFDEKKVIKVILPFRRIKYDVDNDKVENSILKSNKWNFAPYVDILYDLSLKTDLSFTYSTKLNYSPINVYALEPIIYSYLNLRTGSSRLNEKLSRVIEFRLTNTDVIHQRFMNFSVQSKFINYTFLESSLIGENGLIQEGIDDSASRLESYSLIGNYSKKLFGINTLLRFYSSIGITSILRNFNNKIGSLQYVSSSSRLDLEYEPSSSIFIKTSAAYVSFTNQFDSAHLNRKNVLSMHFHSTLKYSGQWLSALSFDYYDFYGLEKRNRSILSNFSTTYIFGKKNNRLTFKCTNLFNSKTYSNIVQDELIREFVSYDLRPFQVSVHFLSSIN